MSDDPIKDARVARLRYVSDAAPGISRIRWRGKFAYRHPDGTPVRDRDTLERIRRLAVPPAYEAVWICRVDNGHLQAVGRDARGRKQYRYHKRWRSVRDEAEFGKILLFVGSLPQIRRQVAADLMLPGLPRARVLAAVVRLLEQTLARIGNEEYARTNGSFGLTTLRNRHVQLNGTHLNFGFPGKHRILHSISLRDRRLANVVGRCRDLPGQELFRYLDDDGEPHTIGSDDVNGYLREVASEDITAKDFRTWAGTTLAARAFAALPPFDSATQAKRNVAAAVRVVAEQLRNTATICRKCYIHPAIVEAYLDGTLAECLATEDTIDPDDITVLSAEEMSVLRFLRRRLGDDAVPAS
jgi:DNA topoisomerase I